MKLKVICILCILCLSCTGTVWRTQEDICQDLWKAAEIVDIELPEECECGR